MSRFSRVLAWAFPSVPPSDLSVGLTAMEGDTQTPAVGAWGSASAAGEAPEGEEQELTRRPVRRGSEHSTQASPSGPPACETDIFWDPSPDARWDFACLGSLLDRWKKEQA